jgi:hypothetical protein
VTFSQILQKHLTVAGRATFSAAAMISLIYFRSPVLLLRWQLLHLFF